MIIYLSLMVLSVSALIGLFFKTTKDAPGNVKILTRGGWALFCCIIASLAISIFKQRIDDLKTRNEIEKRVEKNRSDSLRQVELITNLIKFHRLDSTYSSLLLNKSDSLNASLRTQLRMQTEYTQQILYPIQKLYFSFAVEILIRDNHWLEKYYSRVNSSVNAKLSEFNISNAMFLPRRDDAAEASFADFINNLNAIVKITSHKSTDDRKVTAAFSLRDSINENHLYKSTSASNTPSAGIDMFINRKRESIIISGTRLSDSYPFYAKGINTLMKFKDDYLFFELGRYCAYLDAGCAFNTVPTYKVISVFIETEGGQVLQAIDFKKLTTKVLKLDVPFSSGIYDTTYVSHHYSKLDCSRLTQQ